MYAIVGIPGSVHHTYKRFYRGRRTEAWQWLDATRARILQRNPAVGALPAQFITDREAARVRYQDGRRVYVWDGDESREEERAAAFGAPPSWVG